MDVPEDMTRMTLDTIGLSGFGYDFESCRREDPHPFVQALVRALAHSQAELGRVPGEDHTAEDEAFATDAAFLARIVDDVIERRKAAGDTSTDDLLGLMLGAPHPGSGEPLDDANIRNQVVTFLIAGHETTSGTLSFALYHLLKHPVALHLAQAETDALWGDNPEEFGPDRFGCGERSKPAPGSTSAVTAGGWRRVCGRRSSSCTCSTGAATRSRPRHGCRT